MIMRDKPYPVDDDEFTANVLASWASKEHNWTSKVFGISPTPSWNALRYLAQTDWICQQLLIPGKRGNVSARPSLVI